MAIFSGAGAPDRRVGKLGDHYVDTRAWVLHGPKGAMAWPPGKPIWPDGIPRTFPDIRNDVPLATKGGSQIATKGGASLLGDPPAR